MRDDLLKRDMIRDEGYRNHAYRDSKGWYTIGIGHLLGSSPRMLDVTDFEIMALYKADIEVAIEDIRKVWVGVSLDLIGDVRSRALVNMSFNRGYSNMKNSTCITPAIARAMLHTGTWEQVAEEILKSPWAKDIKKRAERLAFMFAKNQDPL